LDIEVMKKLGKRCNLIPVIAKADTLTPDALKAFKDRIRDCISTHGIQVYAINPADSASEADQKLAQELMVCFLSNSRRQCPFPLLDQRMM
jgi:cell division control protein 12